MTKRLWSSEEEAKLRALYQTSTAEEIARLLGRNVAAVRNRASQLGLKKDKQRARNVRPIGAERMDRGILIRKVTDTGRPKKDWKRVDVIEWEAVNGPVPAGFNLMRKDSSLPRTLDNLALFTKKQHFARASVHAHPPEIVALLQLKGQITKQVKRLSQQAPSPKSDGT